MARDADGKPQETRGRRGISQKTRDHSEKLKSYGAIVESSPRLIESLMTGAFIGSFVYFLRPTIVARESMNPLDPIFRGKRVSQIRITYPDRAMARNLAVLTALIAAPNLGGDIGSILAPAATAGIFAQVIEKTFPTDRPPTGSHSILGFYFGDPGEVSEFWNGYDLAFGPEGAIPGGSGTAPVDVTVSVYAKIVLPRYVRAIFLSAFFYIVLRYVRNIGRN